MSEIVIAGVSIKELKRQKMAMQKEANSFVANTIQQAKAKMDELLEAEDETTVEILAAEATELLENADLVATVCDVAFYIPYRETDYVYCDEDSYAQKIEDASEENEQVFVTGYRAESKLNRLLGVLEGMESKVADWNTSTC